MNPSNSNSDRPRLRVGVFVNEVAPLYPRGIARVAKGIVDALASDPSLEIVWLTSQVPGFFPAVFNKVEVMPKPGGTRSVSWSAKLSDKSVSFLIRLVGLPLTQALLDARRERMEKQRPTDLSICLAELDAILVFDPMNRVLTQPLELMGPRLITWFHDAIPLRINEGAHGNLARFRTLVSRAVACGHCVVCVSPSSQSDAHFFFDASRGKTVVVPNGHDVQFFAAQEGHSPQVRRDDRPVFVVLGAVERRKNIELILRAGALLPKVARDIRPIIQFIGQHSSQAACGFLIDALDGRCDTEFLGYRSDAEVLTLLRRSTALLYPSLWEGFGIPPLEAMSAGTLVVASDIAPLKETCGEHALYCNPYEPRELADAMTQCIQMHQPERDLRIQNARAYAATFTWQNSAQAVSSLIHSLTRNRVNHVGWR